jgi:hypothetical protein
MERPKISQVVTAAFGNWDFVINLPAVFTLGAIRPKPNAIAFGVPPPRVRVYAPDRGTFLPYFLDEFFARHGDFSCFAWALTGRLDRGVRMAQFASS